MANYEEARALISSRAALTEKNTGVKVESFTLEGGVTYFRSEQGVYMLSSNKVLDAFTNDQVFAPVDLPADEKKKK